MYNRPVALSGQHNTSAFVCRELELNTWLAHRALENQYRGWSRSFVICGDDDTTILGYYCLSAASLDRGDAASSLRRNAPDPLPVILLGRLARVENPEHRGLGDILLDDALLRAAFGGTLHVGACALMVEARHPRVAGWYENRGFRPTRTHPLTLTHSLEVVRANVLESDVSFWLGS